MIKADPSSSQFVTFNQDANAGIGGPVQSVSILSLRDGAADFVDVSKGDSEALDPLSIDWLVAQPDLPVLVQMIPAARLYRLIQQAGHDEALEIIEWVRGQQLVKIFDFDLWSPVRPSQSNDFASSGTTETEGKVAVISADRFLDWSSSWHEISPEFAAERFVELEEETMILLARGLFEIVPVGLENGIIITDDYFMSHDKRFHLRFLSMNPEAQERAGQFLSTLYAHRLEFAGRVLSYAAMLVESEVHEEALRWRAGRLADDGFVERAEALAMLIPRELEFWTGDTVESLKSAEGLVAASAAAIVDSGEPSAASGLDVDPEILDSVARCLEAAALSDESGSALAIIEDLDGAAAGAADAALRKLQTLDFRHADAQRNSSGDADRLLIDAVFTLVAAGDPTKLAGLLARLARQANAVASLLSDPASFHAQRRAGALLRATLNLGIEWLVDKSPCPDRWEGQSPSDRLGDSFGVSRVAAAAEIFTQLGIENVFRAGIDLLNALAVHGAKSLSSQLQKTSSGNIRDQGDRIVALVKRQRFNEVSAVLWDLQTVLTVPWVVLSESVLARFPSLPLGLNLQNLTDVTPSAVISQSRKIIERPLEYRMVWRALSSEATEQNAKAQVH
jgi:hypothetical protein